jgi:hypothetical protein
MVTVVNSTIGSGKTYSNATNWEADTDNDLVTLDQQHFGLVASQAYGPTSSSLVIAGATTDATRNRTLTTDGVRCDPRTQSGVVFHFKAGSVNSACISMREAYLTLRGIGVDVDVNGVSGVRGIQVYYDLSPVGQLIDGCTVMITNSSSTAVTASGFHLDASQDSTVRNSVAVGYGVSANNTVIDGFVLTYGTQTAQNCTAHGLLRYGFHRSSGTATVINSVCLSAITAAFNGTITQSYNVSYDATATGTGSLTSQTAAACYSDPDNLDLRPLRLGPLTSGASDLSASFTTDIYGDTREAWAYGAIDRESATVVSRTIGSAGYYATPQLWEADTDDDLVTADERHIGVMAAETFSYTDSFTISGATVDTARYRRLEGAGYDPAADTGTKLVFDLALARRPVSNLEAFGEMGHFGVIATWTGAGMERGISLEALYQVLEGVYLKSNAIAVGGWTQGGINCSFPAANWARIRNCIVHGNGVGTVTGYTLPSYSRTYNCVAYNTGGPGLRTGQGGFFCYNCAFIDCALNSVEPVIYINAGPGALDYIVVSGTDTSEFVAGTTYWLNATPAGSFVDADGGDFRPLAESDLDGNSRRFSLRIDDDIAGNARSFWSIGAYDEAVVVSAGTEQTTSPSAAAPAAPAAPSQTLGGIGHTAGASSAPAAPAAPSQTLGGIGHTLSIATGGLATSVAPIQSLGPVAQVASPATTGLAAPPGLTVTVGPLGVTLSPAIAGLFLPPLPVQVTGGGAHGLVPASAGTARPGSPSQTSGGLGHTTSPVVAGAALPALPTQTTSGRVQGLSPAVAGGATAPLPAQAVSAVAQTIAPAAALPAVMVIPTQVLVSPGLVLVHGEWSAEVNLEPGDQWFVVLSGSEIVDPTAVVVVRFLGE